MKNATMKVLLLAVVIGPPRAPENAPPPQWDGPILPVQDGRVILPLTCDAEQTLQWDETVQGLSLGLKETDAVWALMKSGRVEASLGRLSCFQGECGSNYVSIDLEVPQGKRSEVLAVSRSDFLEKEVKLVAVAEHTSNLATGCEDLYREMTFASFPEEKGTRKCTALPLDDRRTLKMARKGFRQENDWIIHVVKALVVSRDPPGSVQFVDIDSDTDPLEPIMIIEGGTGGRRILWRKAAGICCPSKVTHRMSRIDAEGRFLFGREFTAGGQPCD